MAINLQRGQRIDLTKSTGSKLTHFCVGVNWGAIEIKKKNFFGKEKIVRNAVDLDLSCILLNEQGSVADHIYSPLYNADALKRIGLPPGKLTSRDGALRHSGDDLEGDLDGDDGLDNEIISVDLTRLNPDIRQIFFFINNAGLEDFYQIPFAKIRMYEGTPTKVLEIYATFDVVADRAFSGKKAMIMGKLYKAEDEWKFNAIGDATPDVNIAQTIHTVLSHYSN